MVLLPAQQVARPEELLVRFQFHVSGAVFLLEDQTSFQFLKALPHLESLLIEVVLLWVQL